jgi:hypothetical protein
LAVTHVTAARNGLADFIVDQLDSGFIEIRDSGDTEVATLPLAATAFGAASSGVATAGTITDDSSATGGTAAKAALQTSAPADVVLCSVTATGMGGDIELSSVTIGAGATVSLTSLTYEAAP